MDLTHTVSDLRARLKGQDSIVLVPTMGNLHAGHIALVELARQHGNCVVVSIFVNRLQFEPGGDFDRYPRTLREDCAKLAKAGCDVAFAPDEREMYPETQEILVAPPAVAKQLDGDFRPGHFQGVVTVVAKLFNIVRPHAVILGKKDYQQLHVLSALERQLNFGIRVIGADTVREPDGLAMSSRNGYLSAEERAEAVRLQRNLKHVRREVEGGSRDFARLTEMAEADLAAHGWKVDYVAIRNRAALALPTPADRELVVLGAARLGTTRLIDNLEITIPA